MLDILVISMECFWFDLYSEPLEIWINLQDPYWAMLTETMFR